MGSRPVTSADYDQVRDLHAQHLARNEIARRMHRSGKTISRIATELGLTFDRGAEVQAATEARKADAKARRAALSLALLEDAERLRVQMWQPAKAFNFGGKDNTYAETTLEQPTFADKRNITQAVGVLVERSVRLDEYDAGDSGQVGSLLGALFNRLQTAHGTGDEPAGDA